MHVLVIGAGLAGLTAAFVLAQGGARVSVIERREGPGLETSARNGSLQHVSHVEPWNEPGILLTLLQSIGREDSPTLLRLSALPSLAGWGLSFLRHANAAQYRTTTLANLGLARASLEEMAALRTLGIRYHHERAGTLLLLRSAAALEARLRWARELQPHGLDFEAFSVQQVLAHEPALSAVAPLLAGALHYPGDERGDPAAFCQAMATALRQQGTQLRFGRTVERLLVEGGRVQGAATEGGDVITADAVVLAAASQCSALARPLGLSLPVRPVKGYSITVPRAAQAPRHAVIDPDAHVAVVPVGDDRVRVAGTAEFTGLDLRIQPRRVQALVDRLAALYPAYRAALPDAAIEPWVGLRPMCSDGRCLVGPARLRGLWLHTGHGQLGWTLAAGSARLLADLMFGRAPVVDPGPFSPGRFGL